MIGLVAVAIKNCPIFGIQLALLAQKREIWNFASNFATHDIYNNYIICVDPQPANPVHLQGPARHLTREEYEEAEADFVQRQLNEPTADDWNEWGEMTLRQNIESLPEHVMSIMVCAI